MRGAYGTEEKKSKIYGVTLNLNLSDIFNLCLKLQHTKKGCFNSCQRQEEDNFIVCKISQNNWMAFNESLRN